MDYFEKINKYNYINKDIWKIKVEKINNKNLETLHLCMPFATWEKNFEELNSTAWLTLVKKYFLIYKSKLKKLKKSH